MSGKSVSLTLGEKIRFFRIRAELSQTELENEAKLSSGTISRIENGEINPTIDTRLKIAEALRLDIKEAAYLMNLNLYNGQKNR